MRRAGKDRPTKPKLFISSASISESLWCCSLVFRVHKNSIHTSVSIERSPEAGEVRLEKGQTFLCKSVSVFNVIKMPLSPPPATEKHYSLLYTTPGRWGGITQVPVKLFIWPENGFWTQFNGKMMCKTVVRVPALRWAGLDFGEWKHCPCSRWIKFYKTSCSYLWAVCELFL